MFPGNCESGLNRTNEPMKTRFSNSTPDATAENRNSLFLTWKYTELHLIAAYSHKYTVMYKPKGPL
jgi:hypothetical protein